MAAVEQLRPLPYLVDAPADKSAPVKKRIKTQHAGIGAFWKLDESNRLSLRNFASPSAAEKAGLKVGDLLAAVNGVSLRHMSLEQVGGTIIGPVDSNVELIVFRQGALLKFTVQRSIPEEETPSQQKSNEPVTVSADVVVRNHGVPSKSDKKSSMSMGERVNKLKHLRESTRGDIENALQSLCVAQEELQLSKCSEVSDKDRTTSKAMVLDGVNLRISSSGSAITA